MLNATDFKAEVITCKECGKLEMIKISDELDAVRVMCRNCGFDGWVVAPTKEVERITNQIIVAFNG